MHQQGAFRGECAFEQGGAFGPLPPPCLPHQTTHRTGQHMDRPKNDRKQTPNPPPPPNEDMIDPATSTNAGEGAEIGDEKKSPESTVEYIEGNTPGQAAS